MIESIQATRTPHREGLFRALLGGVGRPVTELFAEFRQRPAAQLFAENVSRSSQGARIMMDRAHGHGGWELYRLDPGLFLVVGDCLYDETRVEIVPGEGLIGFHLRLSGRLELERGDGTTLTVPPSSLLLWWQPAGITVREQIEAGERDASVTLYFRPDALDCHARQNGFALPAWLRTASRSGRIAYAIRPLNPGLLYLAKSLLQTPYEDGLRLLHAEAKALELLCEIVHSLQSHDPRDRSSEYESRRRLDIARRIVTTQFNPPPRIADIARKVRMSESKLKRSFKARFGTTLFRMMLDCRMRYALELLRSTDLAVRQVAYAVGYRHQTTFTAAFREQFGFLPSDARNNSCSHQCVYTGCHSE